MKKKVGEEEEEEENGHASAPPCVCENAGDDGRGIVGGTGVDVADGGGAGAGVVGVGPFEAYGRQRSI